MVAVAAPVRSAPTPGSGLHATPYGGLAWFLIGFELGPWEDYLINELTPDLERLTTLSEPRVSWLDFDDTLIVPDFAADLMRGGESSLALTFRRSDVAMLFSELGGHYNRMGEGYRFQQSLLMPGVTRRMSENSTMTVSAILASQRFGASGMNLRESDTPPGWIEPHSYYDPAQSEVSHGAGLRFAMTGELADGMRLQAAFQSRIDMGEFASVRGVHGAHAELDIPPRVQVGLEFDAGRRSSLNLGMSQIYYSDIGAFPSRSLPARFTALLGDSNSPQFAWDDLVVYNVGWRWHNSDDLELRFDYRTRSQPRPTAPSLASALESELARNSLLVSLTKGVGRGNVHFNAAYAPPEFAFGGNVLGVVSDKLDQDLEVQALWSLEF